LLGGGILQAAADEIAAMIASSAAEFSKPIFFASSLRLPMRTN
jgi:hypothetical protein